MEVSCSPYELSKIIRKTLFYHPLKFKNVEGVKSNESFALWFDNNEPNDGTSS